MQFPATSLLILVSAILSVHTSPVPSRNVALLSRAESSTWTRAIELERRQRGGNGGGRGQGGNGGENGEGNGGAAAAVSLRSTSQCLRNEGLM